MLEKPTKCNIWPEISVIYVLDWSFLGLSTLFVNSFWHTPVRNNFDSYMIWIAETYKQHVDHFSIHFIKCHLVVVSLSPKKYWSSFQSAKNVQIKKYITSWGTLYAYYLSKTGNSGYFSLLLTNMTEKFQSKSGQ